MELDLTPLVLAAAAVLWAISRAIDARYGNGAKLKEINKAVNGVPSGDPTLCERVSRIEEAVSRIEEKLATLPSDESA